MREHIDKFGNPLKQLDELKIVLPMPAYGKIEYQMEENMVEEDADEWARKMKELAMLRAKKNRGEILTEEEQNRLVQLEKEEDEHRHSEIVDLFNKSDKSTEEDEHL